MKNSKLIPNTAKRLHEILTPNQFWQKKCYIIGGGPSASALDWDKIKDSITIGINKAFVYYPDTTINYSMDGTFYRHIVGLIDLGERTVEYNRAWKAYNGIRVFAMTNKAFPFGDEVYTVERMKKKSLCLDFRKGMYAGNNSGWGALNLAIALGCNPIYLIGYDMNVDHVNKKTHWHDGYQERSNINKADKKLARFCTCIDHFAGDIKKLQFDVYNCNPDSGLKNYEKRALSDCY